MVPAAIFLVVYLAPLGVRPVSSPDETRYAQVPQEMIASGDWVVPRLNGLRYFEKPPLGYWMNAISQEVFGPTAFAIRLPAALSAGAVALIVALLLAGAFRDRFVTCVGALAALTMLEVFACGGANILDGPFSLALTATIACGYLACQAASRGQERRWLVLAGVACGLAFLAKGFLAVVLPLAVLLPYLAWQRRLLSALRLVWLPALAAVVVVAPWALAIAARESDFWRYFVMEQHVKRFGSSKAQHAEPFWYFIPVLLAGGLPWVVLLPSALKRHIAERFESPLVKLAACWLLFPFLFFSVSSGKLSTYVLPCFPPLAILVAASSRSLFGGEGSAGTSFRAALGLGITLAVVGLGALATLVPGVPAIAAFADEPGKLAALATGLVVWGGLLVLASRQSGAERRLLLFAASPLLLFMMVPFAIPTEVIKRFPDEIISSIADRVDDGTVLVSDRSYIQPTCWGFKRSDVLILARGGELSYGLKQTDGSRQFTHAELDALLRDPERDAPVVCILDDENHEPFLAYPEPEWKVERPGILMLGFTANRAP